MLPSASAPSVRSGEIYICTFFKILLAEKWNVKDDGHDKRSRNNSRREEACSNTNAVNY